MTESSPQDLARWRAAIEVAAQTIGLHEWHVSSVFFRSLEEDMLAAVSVVAERWAFNVAVSPAALDLSPEEQAHVIIHEVVHVLLDPIDQTVMALVAALPEGLATTAYQTVFRRELEQVVDRVTLLLERLGVGHVVQAALRQEGEGGT